MVDDHRAAHDEPEHVRRRGHLAAHHLLGEDRLLDQGRAAPPLLLGPRETGPAALVELCLPAAAPLESLFLVLRRLARIVGLEPGAQLVAKSLLARTKGQVHGSLLSLSGS